MPAPATSATICPRVDFEHLLLRGRRLADDGDRLGRASPGGQQPLDDRLDMLEGHIDHQHRRAAGERFPIDRIRHQPAGVMAGDEGDGRIDLAMGDRDAGIGEPADPGTDARHDAEGMPAATRARASSPPRPKTKGSPPLRRNTRRPSRASSISRSEMSRCLAEGLPPRFPAYSSITPGCARSRIRSSTSAS